MSNDRDVPQAVVPRSETANAIMYGVMSAARVVAPQDERAEMTCIGCLIQVACWQQLLKYNSDKLGLIVASLSKATLNKFVGRSDWQYRKLLI